MNFAGKILTVAILVLSVMFLTLAVTVLATHRNWRDEVVGAGGLREQVTQLTQTNTQLREEVERERDRLKFEQAARAAALASAQSRAQTINRQLQQRERELSDLQASHSVIVETLNTNQINLQGLNEVVASLQEKLREVWQDRDTQFLKVVEIQDQLNAIEGQRQKLVERQAQLLAQVSRMQNVLERNGLDEYTPVDDIPPSVDGIVTAVGREDLVEISIGSDDGLRRGHTLEVFRNNSYLGRIRVTHTEPDQAVGVILPEYRKGIIKRGDRVATRLS